MKLARIILPERDNDNQSLAWVHQALQEALTMRYGGYTMTKGTGAWDGGTRVRREPVWVYDVAMERAAVVEFRQLAARFAADARQVCVMIVTPQGDVEFVKPVDSNKTVA